MKNDIYSAVGNRVRAKLITCLANGPMNVNDLIGKCSLSQSAVSQHLAKLRTAGLVTTTKRGKEVLYSLKDKRVAEVSELLQSLDK